ncbi:hypothetical protein PVAP13_2KG582859, partial [Panicum virgatum]
MPWDYLAPFVGFAAPGQGFHVIQNEGHEESGKETSSCALIRIISGTVSARQLELEFKAQAGPQSTWRWFAKKINENLYQMRFPTTKKVDDLSFFLGMQMATVPGASFKVEKWNPNAGAKRALEIAWFRIFGLPMELRTERKASFVASCVGLPLEVVQVNLKRWEYVRVKIGCRDMRKVPTIVECLLDLYFYDFTFVREVPSEVAGTST